MQRGSCNYPFKFNRSWLEDPEFNRWLLQEWSVLNPGGTSHDLATFYHMLHSLKQEVKVWIRDKNAQMDSEATCLDCAIVSLLSGSSAGILSHDDQESLIHLRVEKKKILEHYILTWQLKSHSKWALLGDSNTKYFHTLASGRRN